MENEKIVIGRVIDNSKPIEEHREERKDPEEREYLVCIRGKNGADDIWDILVGRTSVYEFIKNYIDSMVIDESFVLVETTKLKDRKSVYAFMKYAEQFYEDNFDIEDYISDSDDEDDYNENYNPSIDGMFDDDNKLSMKSMMDDDIESYDIGEDE